VAPAFSRAPLVRHAEYDGDDRQRGDGPLPDLARGHALVPAAQHQPDLFAADNHRRQKLSPLVDRINDRYGRCAIGFGLFPPDVRAFKGHAAFHRVPERWEF
jgi:hypothetical protein